MDDIYTRDGGRDYDWRDDAACREVDPELFFPTATDSSRATKAKSICDVCRVATQCLEYAVANPELEGVWGGTSFRERQAIRRGSFTQGDRHSRPEHLRRWARQEHARGRAATDIASQLGVSDRTIWRWVEAAS